MVDTDFPEIDFGTVVENRLTGQEIMNKEQYEDWRNKVLSNPLPGDKRLSWFGEFYKDLKAGFNYMMTTYQENKEAMF